MDREDHLDQLWIDLHDSPRETGISNFFHSNPNFALIGEAGIVAVEVRPGEAR